MDTTNEPVQEGKKVNKWTYLVSVIIGLGMLICGIFSVTGDKNTDNTLISGGTTQVCLSLMHEYDDAANALETISYALEAAYEARRNESPEKLNAFINSYFSQYDLQKDSTVVIVQSIMTYVNSAYKKSATEEEYWEKIHVIVSGIRTAVTSFRQPEAA